MGKLAPAAGACLLFTYLANSIPERRWANPYSLVTAMDLAEVPEVDGAAGGSPAAAPPSVQVAAMAAMVVVYAGAAFAASVDELEPNGGYLCCAGAQNIDDYFSLDADPNITNLTGTENTSTTVPHATINGTGDNTYDYYSFTVPEGGGIATIDVDGGYNTDINGLPYVLDSCLRLFDDSSTRSKKTTTVLLRQIATKPIAIREAQI